MRTSATTGRISVCEMFTIQATGGKEATEKDTFFCDASIFKFDVAEK
jgi:hypothetical protein